MAKVETSAPDWKTIESWKKGLRKPQERSKNSILSTFFPSPRSDTAEASCRAMDEAWERLPQSCNRITPHDLESREDLDNWQLEQPQTSMIELVELRLHQPEIGNRGTYYVKATLRIDSEIYRETPDGHGVLISIHEPSLLLHSPGFPVAEGSLLGDRTPHDWFRPIPNGWRILNTSQAKGENLPAGEHLAIISSDGSGKGPVSLTLKGSGRCFRLSLADASGQAHGPAITTDNKDAMINALFGAKLNRDEDGAVILARHSMIKRPEE